MANMTKVNQAIKRAYPSLDIEAVSGAGYVYFDGNDGFGAVESLYCNPSSTATDDLVRFALASIADRFGKAAA